MLFNNSFHPNVKYFRLKCKKKRRKRFLTVAEKRYRNNETERDVENFFFYIAVSLYKIQQERESVNYASLFPESGIKKPRRIPDTKTMENGFE